ncbi:hypothetical protein ACFRMQ_00015 [Kitasatospora sp. NPDC056783]|uniref:hypothetical protein n=1 Tax=Kitasatospora sp. NPDC056783 TaxID=3345943 RepID=UPI0036B2E427
MSIDWRSVPMPPALAARPRTRAGLPVPANTPWKAPGAEPSLRLHHTESLGDHLTCDCVPGQGVAAFGDQCPDEQRRLLLEERCGLCGRELKEGDEPPVFIAAGGPPVFVEPAMHQPCAAFAIAACPVLSSARDRLVVNSFTTYTVHERRAYALDDQGRPRYRAFEVGHPLGRLLGVLDFYIASPDDGVPQAVNEWLAERLGDAAPGAPGHQTSTVASADLVAPAAGTTSAPDILALEALEQFVRLFPRPLGSDSNPSPADVVSAGRARGDAQVHLAVGARWEEAQEVPALCDAVLSRPVELALAQTENMPTCPVCFGRRSGTASIVLPAAAHDAWMKILDAGPANDD